jgi:hypothetical protein
LLKFSCRLPGEDQFLLEDLKLDDRRADRLIPGAKNIVVDDALRAEAFLA